MKQQRGAKPKVSTPILCGVFTKKEAAGHIASGCRHVHSSALKERDPLYVATKGWDEGAVAPTFAWEPKGETKSVRLSTSQDRHEIIKKLTSDSMLASKRHLKDSLSSVLEELLTNAIYHAYRNADGAEKYSRNSNVTLTQAETVELIYRIEDKGIFLEVRDKGGSLSFADVASSFARCYGASDSQIEEKQGGAGLGVYMIFEMVSHLKVVTETGKETRISCWMPDKKSFDPQTFSFNFFQRR